MTKLLFFLSIIIYASHGYASQSHQEKSSYRDITLRNNPLYEKQCLKRQELKKAITQKNALSFKDSFLPTEIYPNVITYATNSVSAKSIKEATQIFSTLWKVNRYFRTFINQPTFSDDLTKNLAFSYHCSHETIAKSLRTFQLKKRLKLQYQLKDLCCYSEAEDNDKLKSKLTELISQGVDLEFTYNHQSGQKTPLMLTMSYNNKMFEYLLEGGANINGTNSIGLSPLHVASSDPINETYCMKLITHPKIAINQQNTRGETALLYSLIHAQRGTNRPLGTMVTEMLKAGANPKLANKKGLTPLKKAQKLKNHKLIVPRIERAINTKQPSKS